MRRESKHHSFFLTQTMDMEQENSNEDPKPNLSQPSSTAKLKNGRGSESISIPSSEPIKIEDIYNELGGFSWFQIFMTLLIISPEIPTALIAVSPIFVGTSNVPFACRMENENPLEPIIISGQSLELCSGNCSEIISQGGQLSSIVQEWNLICDRAWITDAFASIQMLGMTTGSVMGSYIADVFGRKKAFFFMSFLMSTFGICSGFVTEEYLYGAMRYFAGIGCGGFYVVFSIYLIEFLTPSWRTVCGCVSVWFLGEMFLSVAAYFIQPWRILTVIVSSTGVLIFFAYPFIPESPRYLLCRGETAEATRVFQRIAYWNSRPVVAPEKIEKLQASVHDESAQAEGSNQGAMLMVTNSKLRIKLLIFLTNWFACALIYYGITFNLKNLNGNPYWNLMFLALVDMPSFPSGAIFNNWLGRKRTYSFSIIFGALGLLILVVVEELYGLSTYPTLITILIYMARIGVCAAWGVVFCFTAESFPTVVRGRALGLCSLAANAGGVIAPILAYAGAVTPAVPYFVFCSFAVLSAVSSCFLSETNGKPLKNFI